jgi:hypothetical protein
MTKKLHDGHYVIIPPDPFETEIELLNFWILEGPFKKNWAKEFLANEVGTSTARIVEIKDGIPRNNSWPFKIPFVNMVENGVY